MRALGRPIDLDLIEHSLEVLEDAGLDPVVESEFGFLAAQIFDEVSKDRTRARRMTEAAIERYESADADPGTKVQEMRAWLASHPARG